MYFKIPAYPRFSNNMTKVTRDFISFDVMADYSNNTTYAAIEISKRKLSKSSL